MVQLTRWFVVAVAVLGLVVGTTAQSYAIIIINISDSTEGPPIVTQTGTDVVTLTTLSSQNEFVHFTFTVGNRIIPSIFLGTTSVDIFSQAPGPTETLSDRFLITVTTDSNLFDVQFDSRETILIPTGTNQNLSQEDGNLHQMYSLALADAPQFIILAASDVDRVPQPASLLLLSLGGIGVILGHVLRRQRSAA